ncbi:hypothetical protein QYG06_17890 [Xanthomonas euvesicatoria]|uniref:Uncharacterized protein YhdP n=3 Tax=Xanthomonas TaxID=338 RepID=A0AB73H5Q1_9XANT|nr:MULTISPECIES: hypothetical protein [Xanthomonas]AOY69483.1 hypothetical protein BHE83_23195 [Xanthomonas euvesicatoria pv. vesicatoria str. 85-10]APO88725.1 hypothetical protein BJD11_00690 [Xanthomonas euvesicatoria]KHL62524.1 hypothetical protein XEU66b_06485 [Xanthomonas euvesicatoria]KLB38593.1 hypothetical protein XEUV206_19595 [Xanthomonas euvesicatoria]KLB43761.1 hypothetical protein XEUV259_20485 [Xanthomonas euvesicatoria]
MSENSQHQVIRNAPAPVIAHGQDNPAPNITPAALAQRLNRYADELSEVGRAYSATLLRAAACAISELLKAKAQAANSTAVPERRDELELQSSEQRSYNSGWNACRAAMLGSHTLPPVQCVDLPEAITAAATK